jgi:hypothetical protein
MPRCARTDPKNTLRAGLGDVARSLIRRCVRLSVAAQSRGFFVRRGPIGPCACAKGLRIPGNPLKSLPSGLRSRYRPHQRLRILLASIAHG